MKETLAELSNNLEEQQAAIRANFQAIRDALASRESATLEALQLLKDTKDEVLNNQIDSVNKMLGVIDDGVNNINVVLNHSNDLELVYLTIVLQEFIGDLSRIDTGKFASISKSLSYYKQPAVDADLPVALSDQVPGLVEAYAAVPDAEQVQDLADGKANKLKINSVSREQAAALREVSNGQANESNCVVQ
mmetsp:Transcript_6726/g.7675  ORF Transcript_6726/g.7675 Transcript_6726/m.7675 type:complete len:191 (+) Transcript_6726:952-1524(+)